MMKTNGQPRPWRSRFLLALPTPVLLKESCRGGKFLPKIVDQIFGKCQTERGLRIVADESLERRAALCEHRRTLGPDLCRLGGVGSMNCRMKLQDARN